MLNNVLLNYIDTSIKQSCPSLEELYLCLYDHPPLESAPTLIDLYSGHDFHMVILWRIQDAHPQNHQNLNVGQV